MSATKVVRFVACVEIVFALMLSTLLPNSRSVPTSAVHAGKLIDVRTGRVTSNTYILLAKDRILRIADSAPADIPTIDLSKYTVVPGLIDSHAHVLGNPKDQSSASGLRMSSAQKALWGVHNLQTWLDHGFTALRDAGEDDLGYGQLALRDSINKGLIRGPRMVSAGNFVSVNGGHGDADVLAPDQAFAAASKYRRYGGRCQPRGAARHQVRRGLDQADGHGRRDGSDQRLPG